MGEPSGPGGREEHGNEPDRDDIGSWRRRPGSPAYRQRTSAQVRSMKVRAALVHPEPACAEVEVASQDAGSRRGKVLIPCPAFLLDAACFAEPWRTKTSGMLVIGPAPSDRDGSRGTPAR